MDSLERRIQNLEGGNGAAAPGLMFTLRRYPEGSEPRKAVIGDLGAVLVRGADEPLEAFLGRAQAAGREALDAAREGCSSVLGPACTITLEA